MKGRKDQTLNAKFSINTVDWRGVRSVKYDFPELIGAKSRKRYDNWLRRARMVIKEKKEWILHLCYWKMFLLKGVRGDWKLNLSCEVEMYEWPSEVHVKFWKKKIQTFLDHLLSRVFLSKTFNKIRLLFSSLHFDIWFYHLFAK